MSLKTKVLSSVFCLKRYLFFLIKKMLSSLDSSCSDKFLISSKNISISYFKINNPKLTNARCLLKYCLLFTAYCLLHIKTYAQDTLAIQEPQIVVMARPTTGGTIMLRWAVTTSKAWRKLNTYGYELKRYTVTRNKITLTQPIELSLGTFKPKPLEEWMAIIEDNDNAAVMAQSLYGDSFDVEGQDELSAIVNLAEEQEQRFTWGMYAADQDYQTAQIAGLGYIDYNVQPNEKYVYKITSLVPVNELNIEDGGVFIGLQDLDTLPKPLDLAVIFMDSKVMLSWNYAIHNQTYNSYFVERSEDGSTFQRLNKLPLTSLNNSGKTDSKRMFYIDSVSNGKRYHYRILGKTPFGELSPESDVVFGKGEKLLEYVPHITTKNYIDDKSIVIEWEFLKEGNAQIKGFELSRSDKADGNYKVVMKGISPEVRKLQYDSLQPTNYMVITAIGKNGSKRSSFPALIQPVDSVPPVKPIRFKGTIDSLGIVTLNWDANKEEDILGYRLFRGNNKNEEYSQITVSPHQGITYFDSISVKNLNSKVYYQLVAVDKRFNMSEPSEILEVKKPDFIKPTQPVFKSYSIDDGKVNITWANSSSDDVVKHLVYRKETDSLDWKLVYTADSTPDVENLVKPFEKLPTSNWNDEDVEENRQYSYTIIAVDDSNLESDPSPPLTIIVPRTTMPPAVEGLNSYVDKKNGYIELYWKPYKQGNVAELSIYKGIKDKPITLMRNVSPTVKRIVDEKVKPNNEYIYIVRAVFKSGRVSETATLNVKY